MNLLKKKIIAAINLPQKKQILTVHGYELFVDPLGIIAPKQKKSEQNRQIHFPVNRYIPLEIHLSRIELLSRYR